MPNRRTKKSDPMRQATDLVRAVVEHPDDYPDRFVVLPMDPDVIARILSRERTRVVAYLQRHGPAPSLRVLAAELDRNYASLSRDVSALTSMGLVETIRRGKEKQIQATGRPILIQ